MAGYTYQPLTTEVGQLRLMRLQPCAAGASGIRCELFSASLADKPTYTALSYCWGSSSTPHTLSVDGRDLPITSSLYHALQHLQQNEPRTLWIDAICINQQDAAEKGSQVSQMRHIYKSAERVVCWLGQSHDGSDEAMLWIRRFGQWSLRLGIGQRRELYLINLLEQWRKDRGEMKHAEMGEFLTSLWQSVLVPADTDLMSFTDSMAKFLNRQYWRRMWVVQEVYNGKQTAFLCGKCSVDEEELNAALRLLRNLQYYRHIHSAKFVGFDQLDTFHAITLLKMRRAGRGKASLPLVYLLRHFRKAHCGLKVDRIFALLGLAADTEELGLKPDYTATNEEIFTRVARALIVRGFVEILSFCNSTDRTTLLPSWVPIWSSNNCVSLQQRALVRSGAASAAKTEVQPNFNACGNLPLMISTDFIRQGIELTVVSVRVGCLGALGPDFRTSRATQWLRWLVESQPAKASNEQEHLLAACTTAVAGQQVRGGPMKLRSNPDTIQKVCDLLRPWPDDPLPRLREAGFEDYCQQLVEIAGGRRPFRTDTGLVGIGPEQAEAGDIAFVVAGSSVPLLFRPLADTEQVRLVGEAYIYGNMDGEAVSSTPEIELLRIV